MNYGLIGDCHIGFKAYGSDRRSQETIDVLEQALHLLKDKELIMFAGDFFDDTAIPNWIKKQVIALKEKYASQVWLVLGGNHDSTKTYSSVSALDVFGEVNNVKVVNSHRLEAVSLCGLEILCIPHMKSQKEYLEAVESVEGNYDVALLHSLVNSGLDLGPNDLNLDLYRLSILANKCKAIYIGHQHEPLQLLPNAWIPGSIMEFDFGQLGAKYIYDPKPILLTQPRKMERVELECKIDLSYPLSEDTIYRIDIKNIPIDDYSNVKSMCDLIEAKFKGDVNFSLYKLGHKELQVTAIDARFDLLVEFDNFCVDNKIEVGRKRGILQDAITTVTIEEEEL